MQPGKDKGAVGYGRPPEKSQFRKGRSGNPSGRPKGAKKQAALDTLLAQLAAETVTVTEHGKTKRMAVLELVLKRLLNDAAGGKLPALRLILSEFSRLNRSANPKPDDEADDLPDEQIVANLLGRLRPIAGQND